MSDKDVIVFGKGKKENIKDNRKNKKKELKKYIANIKDELPFSELIQNIQSELLTSIDDLIIDMKSEMDNNFSLILHRYTYLLLVNIAKIFKKYKTNVKISDIFSSLNLLYKGKKVK